jgi:hypothetical protein
MGGRGREGEPSKWTGWAFRLKCVSEANPGYLSMTAEPSLSNQAEVTVPQAVKKSLSPDWSLPVPQTDTGRQRELSSGERATLCQGTRQINPVPSEEGVPE